jgi:hypothetical protein
MILFSGRTLKLIQLVGMGRFHFDDSDKARLALAYQAWQGV